MMMVMARIILFVCFLLVMGGCGKKPVMYQDSLRITTAQELPSVDPQKVYNDGDYKVLEALFEGLVVPDPETMEALPGVAERWVVSEDGLVYEFFLREDARWSDGAPVVAEDFVFAVKRALSSKFICPFVELFFDLKNAKPFFDRQIRDFGKVGICALNSKTLRVELWRSNPYFLQILMHPCWSPLTDRVVESFGQFSRTNIYDHAVGTAIISNGPFEASTRVSDKELILTKNVHYWDRENVLLKRVSFVFEKNLVTAARAFNEQMCDICEAHHDSLLEIGNFVKENELCVVPAYECVALVVNTTQSGLKDPRVRRALALAIDRERLLDSIHKNRKLAAYNFVPLVSCKYQHVPVFSGDVEEARRLLVEAGYPGGAGLPELKILCSLSDQGLDAIALDCVVRDWKERLGVNASVESKGLDGFFISRKRGAFAAAKVSYSAVYPDPLLMLRGLRSKSTKNYGKWNDRGFDAMFDDVARAVSRRQRCHLIDLMEGYLSEQMPIIPLFFESQSYMVHRNVKGWFPNSMNFHPIKFVYVELGS